MRFIGAAILALAAGATAEPLRQPLIQRSGREIFGLMPRQGDGYSPTQTLCTGGGSTCQTACGPTFDQCPSIDGNIHCFDLGAKQTCCSNGNGNSCDAGYYCSHDAKGVTMCCPAGTDLVGCKKLFPSAQGDLVSEVPTSKVSSTPAAATSSKAAAATTTPGAVATTTGAGTSPTIVAANTKSSAHTTGTGAGAAAATTATTTSKNAAATNGAVGVMVAVAGAALVALV